MFPTRVTGVAEAATTGGEVIRWGTALDWAITLTIAISALIIVCILIARIVFRYHQTEGSALWLHLLGLGVLPLFVLVTGNFAVLEYATEVQFCGTCHLTMKAYIDDLHNPKSPSLAAAPLPNASLPIRPASSTASLRSSVRVTASHQR